MQEEMKINVVLWVILMSCQLALGQNVSRPDAAINGAFRLCVYEEETKLSVEQFANIPADQIALIDDLQWPAKYLPYTLDFDGVSLFVNADSTELLVAGQAHGLMKNQYEAFLIIPMEENIRQLLSHPGCIHTNYAHFLLDCGLGLDSPLSEVLRIKGEKYSVLPNGDWKYCNMSEAYKEELRTLNLRFDPDDGGDVSQIFAFDEEKIYCILWYCDM